MEGVAFNGLDDTGVIRLSLGDGLGGLGAVVFGAGLFAEGFAFCALDGAFFPVVALVLVLEEAGDENSSTILIGIRLRRGAGAGL